MGCALGHHVHRQPWAVEVDMEVFSTFKEFLFTQESCRLFTRLYIFFRLDTSTLFIINYRILSSPVLFLKSVPFFLFQMRLPVTFVLASALLPCCPFSTHSNLFKNASLTMSPLPPTPQNKDPHVPRVLVTWPLSTSFILVFELELL